MSLYRPNDLLQFLDEYNLRPNKRLSQNFLIDQNILDKIIQCAHVQKKDVVLEIGSGPGALTQKIMQKAKRVIAVEKDHGFARALQRFQADELEIIEADILQLDLSKILTQKTKVIANLPYNITSKVIAKIFEYSSLIDSVTVMVQKEIALRMCAKNGGKEYSHLSVFMQLVSDVQYGFDVKPASFFPKPKIDSAIVQCIPKNKNLPDGLFDFTKTAFQQKRKMLKGSLSKLYEKTQIENALKQLQKLPTARPQDLSPQEFHDLYLLLSS